jgi:L,D-peptidoglycan transpeptidase YkuD (ErfK/YbiS/YcfS/YnhG family)
MRGLFKPRPLTVCLALLALLGAAALAALRAAAARDEPAPLSAGEEAMNRRPLRLPLKAPRLLVRKSARRLELFAGGRRVRIYRVALGSGPVGDKRHEGDGRTPEGDFRVCTKNERSNFYLSLGLDYPRPADAASALRDGLITRDQHDQIVRAARARRCPPWDTPLGGEIFIHGGGAASDWTLGCVALDNEHIQELFQHLPVGTPVRIEP